MPDGNLASAPGRVTVIGGHTGDNLGFVISAALPLRTTVNVREVGGPDSTISSDAFDEPLTLRPGCPVPQTWGRYVAGALRAARADGAPDGLQVQIASDLPMRRGLASSAALVSATMLAANPALRRAPADLLLSRCRQAECSAVGVQCGIIDYYTNLFADGGRLLLLDCRAQTHEHLDWPQELSLVVCDSGVQRELVNSQFNNRRAECLAVARASGQPSLREVSARDLAVLSPRMPLAARRARHVLAENQRVLRFADALIRRDYDGLKQLMAAAHRSARVDYACSSTAQDRLVRCANAAPGCIGARLTGAGWGGATVNLVLRDQAARFVRHMEAICGPGVLAPRPAYFVFDSPARGALSVALAAQAAGR